MDLAAQAASIELVGNHRRFLVARMGYTGSTWLAKLLNSHLDVICTHEQVVSRVHPRKSFSAADVFELVRAIAWNTYNGAYRAAGDVGSIFLGHAIALRGKFTTALLMRHPARLLNARLKVYPTYQHFAEIESETRVDIQQTWDIDVSKLSALDRRFVGDLFTFVTQVQAIGNVDFIIRIEDLRSADRCHEISEGLTGIQYDTALVLRAMSAPVNRHTAAATVREIVERFTPQQREWYQRLLRDAAQRFGYALDSDEAIAQSA
ncbi:MAG: hypothetical protein LAP38_09820 [Acidobacteriia bacterium]|nr:hypothetical protein [Terriglobia bacterium]